MNFKSQYIWSFYKLKILETFSACLFTKQRQLGFPNQIVDNWKSDTNQFGRLLNNNLNFKVKIVLLILIWIYF